MEEIFKSRLSMKVLLYLFENNKRTNIEDISFALRKGYSNVHNIITFLESLSLVTRKKEGRKVFVSLTVKGKTAAENLHNLKDL